MNIIFLDFDGVVNTPIWNDIGTECTFGNPFHGKVNNFQAVQWVSEFCEKYNYGIVVTSTWRRDPDYKDFLLKGGLRPNVQIVGRTPSIRDAIRGDEIKEYLNQNPQVENFIILDDDEDMGIYIDHLIKCNSLVGFTAVEFHQAEALHAVLTSKSYYKN